MRGFETMEDEEALEVAKAITNSMLKGSFDLSYLNGAIRDNALFRRLGFEQALAEDEVVECAKRETPNHRQQSTTQHQLLGNGTPLPMRLLKHG